jgi:acetylornithine deacetylase/succinyl-diaminopimelate desuccinylase-like protein
MAQQPVGRPPAPRASYNFGRIGGGTSVNAIAEEAWVEVDLRSEDAGELERLEQALAGCLRSAVEAEKAWARSAEVQLELDLQPIGRRPSGSLPAEHAAVRLAVAASRLLGIQPRYEILSTDANVPIGLGLPGLALGYGGRGGDLHSVSEWYDPTGSERAMQRNLLLVLALLSSE